MNGNRMSEAPRISVIMSVYNGGKYLREAIESILGQTFEDFEFVIINDASTDNSREIIHSYDDDRIRLVDNEENIGLTKSLNKALRLAKGKYVARQDADDVSLPNRFEEQIRYLEDHAEVVLLGTSVHLIDESGKTIGKRAALVRPTASDMSRGNQFCHGSVVFVKGVVVEVGGYNEVLKYVQDYELWRRIARSYEVRNLIQPLYKHRLHGGRVGIRAQETYAIYQVLALRLSESPVDEATVELFSSGQSHEIYRALTKTEKVRFDKTVAVQHMENGDLKLARQHYKRVFALAPGDIMSSINLVRSYLGRRVYAGTSKIYQGCAGLISRVSDPTKGSGHMKV